MRAAVVLDDEGLTRRQRQIWEFMVAHQDRHGRPPTLQEIATKFKFASRSGALCHVTSLLKKGKLRAHRRVTRSYYVAIPPQPEERANGPRQAKGKT
jgi:SOS-response transcriptional repressor LexA